MKTHLFDGYTGSTHTHTVLFLRERRSTLIVADLEAVVPKKKKKNCRLTAKQKHHLSLSSSQNLMKQKPATSSMTKKHFLFGDMINRLFFS